MKRCLRCQREFETRDWRCPGCGFAPDVVAGVPAFASGLPADDGLRRLANRTLGPIMALERGLIAAALSLSVGGSLLAVAQPGRGG